MNEKDLAERERQVYMREALAEYPGARGMEDFITAADEAGIRDQAQRLHERSGGGSDSTFDRARQAYGPGPSVGGGTAPTGYSASTPDMAKERWNMQFAERFNEAPRDAYGQRLGISPADVTRYTNNRFISHVRDRLNFFADMTRSDSWRRRQ